MALDRLSIRQRPSSRPIMQQVWDHLVFLHWPLPPNVLRPHVPPDLELDTFDGSAWIGLTPFTMRGIRLRHLPTLPLVRRTHELNVRTYVRYQGVPGVWFFSLDASNPLLVVGARATYALPYYHARMRLAVAGDTRRFESVRRHPMAEPAHLRVAWRALEPLADARPDEQAFFLIERYCLYATRGDRLYRARIHHEPWPLRRVELEGFESTMTASLGLPNRSEALLLHALARPLRVDVWPLERVGRLSA